MKKLADIATTTDVPLLTKHTLGVYTHYSRWRLPQHLYEYMRTWSGVTRENERNHMYVWLACAERAVYLHLLPAISVHENAPPSHRVPYFTF